MGLKKVIKNLGKGLTELSEEEKLKSCERLSQILEKLEGKKDKLEGKIDKETNSTKLKRLKTELKVVKLQLKKGHKAIEEIRCPEGGAE